MTRHVSTDWYVLPHVLIAKNLFFFSLPDWTMSGRLKTLSIMSGASNDSSNSPCSTLESSHRKASINNNVFVVHNGRRIVKKKKRQCVKCKCIRSGLLHTKVWRHAIESRTCKFSAQFSTVARTVRAAATFAQFPLGSDPKWCQSCQTCLVKIHSFNWHHRSRNPVKYDRHS